MDNRNPFIFKTTDYGKTWKALGGGIPKSPFSYVHVVREDPFRKGMLYAGTENGLYVSFDDGARWRPLQSKLPHAPVYWLTVEPRFHDLVVATYGRGFYILDDVTALEEWSENVRESEDHLFAPVPSYRFRAVSQPAYAPTGTAEGKNAPEGALLSYWLKKEVAKPKKKAGEDDESAEKPPLVAIRIFDSTGREGAVASRKQRGRHEPRRLGPALRLDPGGAASRDPEGKPPRLGGEAVRRQGPPAGAVLRHRGRDEGAARAPRHIHGEAPGRRPRDDDDGRGPEGPEFGRNASRHRGGVEARRIRSTSTRAFRPR